MWTLLRVARHQLTSSAPTRLTTANRQRQPKPILKPSSQRPPNRLFKYYMSTSGSHRVVSRSSIHPHTPNHGEPATSALMWVRSYKCLQTSSGIEAFHTPVSCSLLLPLLHPSYQTLCVKSKYWFRCRRIDMSHGAQIRPSRAEIQVFSRSWRLFPHGDTRCHELCQIGEDLRAHVSNCTKLTAYYYDIRFLQWD